MAPMIFCAPEVLPLLSIKDGRNGSHTPPVRTAVSGADDDGERDRERRDFDRQVLLAACNGCENTLQLAHGIASGEVSCGDIAKTLRKTRGDAYRWGRCLLGRIGKTISLADAAVVELADDASGFTIDPHQMSPVRGMDVFAVSLFGYETRFSACPDRLQITSYVAAHFETIFQRAGRFLGGWHDKARNEFCLDVTKLFPSADKASALRFARLHQQEEFTNLLTFEVVWRNERRRQAA